MEPSGNEPDLNFFQLAGDQAEQVFFVFDLSANQFSYINAAFGSVWKQNREDVIGNTAFLLKTIHPEDRQYVAEKYRQFIAQKHTTEIEFRILWPDATDRWIRLWVYPTLQNEQIHYVAGIALDDSEKKNNFFHMEKINAKKKPQWRFSPTI
jgi:two-component system sensor histidine kinase VicK